MTTRIPKACMPVVRVLRRDVKRPRWRLMVNHRAARFSNGCCLLGLLPGATYKTPVSAYSCRLPVKYELAIKETYEWWDRLTLAEAREAIDLIWPKKRKAT